MDRLLTVGERTYQWIDERLGLTGIIKATALHNVPRSVNWWYVFGSALITTFIIQVITGMFLAMSYVPSPDHAYASLYFITHKEILGNVLRGIHLYSGDAMVLIIFIHMSSHFLTGSYKYPRELQWWTGSVLLILTIVMAFTGQLLRWNQDAYWAIVVGAEQGARTPIIGQWIAQLLAAGPYVNGTTLTRFYAIHIWLVPGGIITFMTIHVYLVIYKGISEWPEPGKPVDPKTYWAEYQRVLHEDGEPFFPRAVFKDAVFNFIVILAILFCAIVVGTEWLGPLGTPADPTTPANPKPDWYLIWYFGILALVPPASTPWVIILAPALGFGILFLFPLANKGERSYKVRPWAVVTVALAAFATALLIYIGYQEPWKPLVNLDVSKPPAQQVTIPQLSDQSLAGLSPAARHGGQLMHVEACLACHLIGSVGGRRGPNLTYAGDRLDEIQMIWRITRGGGGMPAYGNVLKPSQVDDLVAFLKSRTANKPVQAASGTGGGGRPPGNHSTTGKQQSNRGH